METASMAKLHELICPSCGAEPVYKYGRAWTGKQRFLCLSCKRQFTSNDERLKVKNRPFCPKCGSSMHLYKREEGAVRFRCSLYPGCKTFKKISIKED
jgi:transposase-like protein